jgi:hypothetical protein
MRRCTGSKLRRLPFPAQRSGLVCPHLQHPLRRRAVTMVKARTSTAAPRWTGYCKALVRGAVLLGDDVDARQYGGISGEISSQAASTPPH